MEWWIEDQHMMKMVWTFLLGKLVLVKMDGYKLQQNNNICDSNTHGVEGSGDSKIQLLNL
jgi:hypothetical protein